MRSDNKPIVVIAIARRKKRKRWKQGQKERME